MNVIDYVYYNVYRWYRSMRNSGRNVDPLNMSSTIFGLCFAGWTMVGIWLYYHFSRHKMQKEVWVIAAFVGFLGSFLIDAIYNSSKQRYIKVFNYYSSSNELSKWPIFFSFLFLILPHITIILCVIFYRGY